jgi:hypothetical protein
VVTLPVVFPLQLQHFMYTGQAAISQTLNQSWKSLSFFKEFVTDHGAHGSVDG